MDKFLSKLVEYPQIEQVSTSATASSSEPPEERRNIFDTTRRTVTAPTSQYIQQHGFALGLEQHTAGQSFGSASTSSARPQFSNLTSGDPARNMNPLFKIEESFDLPAAGAPQLHDPWHEQQAYRQQWELDFSAHEVAPQKPELSTTMLPDFTNFPNPVAGEASSSQPAASTSSGDGGQWAPNLLVECARAIAANDTPRIQSLMWGLNELASPYGDCDQRLASYFLQALFCRVTGTGARCHSILCAAAEKTYSFESLRKMILTFQVQQRN